MIDEVIRADDEEVVDQFVSSNAGVLHKDGSKSVESFNDEIKEVFVPRMVIGQFTLPRQREVRVAFKFIQEVVVI